MLEIKNLNIKIKNNILFSGEFRAYPGQITVIKGAIGSGKTTFYKNLFQLNFDVFVNHQKMKNKEEWHKEVAYVNQDVQQYNDLTFQELVDCFCFDNRFSFEDIGVEFISNKKIKHCSEGEKQRLALLVALWKKPAILLLDEPTSYLDNENQRRILHLIKNYTEERKCITVLSTHYNLNEQFEQRSYEIHNKRLILVKEEMILEKLKFSNNRFDLTCLITWLNGNVVSKINKIILFILSLSLLFIILTSHQLNKTQEKWFNSNERYALSYVSFNKTKEIYCKECIIEANGEYLIIGLMNYYDGMNMYTKDIYRKGDIIVNDALQRKLRDKEITIDNHSFKVTNVMKADMNKSLEPYRYMLYIPHDMYVFEEEINPIYYALIYKSENQLKQYKEEIGDDINFINILSIEERYVDLTTQLQGYRIMLLVVPLILGFVLILARWILERKYYTKLTWPIWYGCFENYLFLNIYSYIIILFVLILLGISYLNKEVSLWIGAPYLLYFIFEIILFLKRMK